MYIVLHFCRWCVYLCTCDGCIGNSYNSYNMYICAFVSICAASHLLWNVLIGSGAMNEPVMADTLPFTTECSHWIVTMSVMSLPTCIAQTDGCAKF